MCETMFVSQQLQTWRRYETSRLYHTNVFKQNLHFNNKFFIKMKQKNSNNIPVRLEIHVLLKKAWVQFKTPCLHQCGAMGGKLTAFVTFMYRNTVVLSYPCSSAVLYNPVMYEYVPCTAYVLTSPACHMPRTMKPVGRTHRFSSIALTDLCVSQYSCRPYHQNFRVKCKQWQKC
jgi:hypothetical protein